MLSAFTETLFSPRRPVSPSRFIRAMHPKAEIRPDAPAVRKVLGMGWGGQLKIHGHRAQIHVPADPKTPILVFNRQGELHKKAVSPALDAEIRRVLAPQADWSAIDAEWLKADDRVFLFDFLKREGRSLETMPYEERWALLPRVYRSPFLETLEIFRTADKCLEALARTESWVEGLVFKSLKAPGFSDASVVRCRKR